ncbi:MAG TPA: type IVB secretion system protein IcmH/DotU [Pyrinomonadaceae bacterium]|jgi:type VI secretion system protein ImpK
MQQPTTRLKAPVQQTAQQAQGQPPVGQRRPRMDTSLAGLAAPVLELVMQVRAGIVKPSKDLRPKIAAMLKEMEERGDALRYRERQIQSVKFALAAFMDETVLTADFPLRDEWEKSPLQLEYFGEHLAGVKFFERLEEMLKDKEPDGELIEVYYLCLLLGYKGKYKIYFEEQLKGAIKEVAERLRGLGRLVDVELSPHWMAQDQPEPPRETGLPLWVKIGSGILLGLVLLIYMVLYFLLRSNVNEAIERLLR